MYLLALIPVFIITYFILIWWISVFFGGQYDTKKYDFRHILCIVFSFFSIVFLVASMEDPELANRVQHALGGGFMITLIIFFSVRISLVSVSRFQFFCISLMLATAFGVANELAESLLQVYFDIGFAMNIEDTWWDLWSNSIGALLGSSIFTYFLGKKI